MSKAFKKIKKVAKKVVKAHVDVFKAVVTDPIKQGAELVTGRQAMQDSMEGLAAGMQPGPEAIRPDLQGAEYRSSEAERARRRKGKAGGRASSLLAGSAAGNLGSANVGTKKLLGG